MLSSLALVSVLTTAVLAQSSGSAAPPAPSANPLIPSGISASCTSFLTALDTDSSVKTCFAALRSATAPFAPGSTVTPSSASVSSALTSLCSDSVTSACDEALIRSKITAFYTACPAELTTNKVPLLLGLYDRLYTALPLRTSICAKDDSATWCALTKKGADKEVSSAGNTVVDLANLLASLYTSDASALKKRAEVALLPNMATFHDTNLPFLFFTPDLEISQLCTTCARQVMTAYMKFEVATPYAPGIANSALIDTQAALYTAITDKCPAGFFTTGNVQAVGGVGSSKYLPTSGAALSASPEQKTLVALALGLGAALVL